MSNKFTVGGIVICAALAAAVLGQDKPSPFGEAQSMQASGQLDNQAPPPPPPPVAAGTSMMAPTPVMRGGGYAPAPASAYSAPAYGAPVNTPAYGAPVNRADNSDSPDARQAAADAAASVGPAMKNTAASRDPFPEDVAAVNQADMIWRAAQNRLEELGSGCVMDGTQIIDQARDAKLKSVASYAKYYQDTVTYWTKSRDSSGEAEMSSRTDSAELQAHVNQLQLELQSVNRRKADLDRTFGENHVNNADEKAALADLTRIQNNKQEQVEKARAALEQNRMGHEWVMKRKEYARVRLSETTDLLQSTRTELYLYQQLYNAILYRHSLSCDRQVARPIETLSDWRSDLKKLSPASE